MPETQEKKFSPILPVVKERNTLIPLVSGLTRMLLLLGMFALALPLDAPAGMSTANESALRVVLDSKGK